MLWEIGIFIVLALIWLFSGKSAGGNSSNNSFHEEDYHPNHPYHHRHYHSNDTDYSVPDSWDD